MTEPRVYLAGPDVFEPDARARYAKLSILAEANGLQAIVPMDAEGEPARADEAPAQAAQRIFLANIARLDAADGMVANLADFRGCEPDSGTVFEVGYAVACGIPVVGYGVPAAEYSARVAAYMPTVCGADGTLREQATGREVENFGQPLNLMLACAMQIAPDAEAAMVLLAERLG